MSAAAYRGLRARGSDIFTDRPRGAVRRATISVRTVCADSRSVVELSDVFAVQPAALFFDPRGDCIESGRGAARPRGLRLHRGDMPLQHLEVVQPS